MAYRPEDRRTFLSNAASSMAATSLVLSGRGVHAASGASRFRVGVIGCGNQGKHHQKAIGEVDDIELVYVCDVDSVRLHEAVERTPKARPVSDFRKILEDDSIDGVTLPVPDHWHAPAALMALKAGKHVYVEKPCSHNIREGRWLLDAARTNNLVVQHGTQSRSNPSLRQAIAMLHDGVIGDVLIAKAWNWQRRDDIGQMSPSEPPGGLNYENWVGPAEWLPHQANRLHYHWHWWFNFGCGGIGNDGIHELDYALWGLGPEDHPSEISAMGGKYFFHDDQQFPDTQQVSYEFGGDQQRMLIYEQRLWSTNYPFNVDNGAEFYGTKGRMLLTKRGKFEVYGERNRRLDVKLPTAPIPRVADHLQNWVDATRLGERPNADIAIGHQTATAVHLGNIAWRVGRKLRFDPIKERMIDDPDADRLLGRSYRADGHWGVPELA